jgi:DNA-binding response OmpR family regulator
VTPVETKILLIEGKRAEHPTFYAGLTRKDFDVSLVLNGSRALSHLETQKPHMVLINAASMRTSGRRICQSIRRFDENLPIVLVIDKNTKHIDKLNADVILILPFTLQKLLNRIRVHMPAEEKNLVIAGPIKIDRENRWVRCFDRQKQLTPRLVALLLALMEHPGEVFDREELFRLVWETGYTGDTRTLDVHISWLRQAIEENPRQPQFIKTVRGIGYCLDVDGYYSSSKPGKKQKKK